MVAGLDDLARAASTGARTGSHARRRQAHAARRCPRDLCEGQGLRGAARQRHSYQKSKNRRARPQTCVGKKMGLTRAVHLALEHELAREQAKSSLVEIGVQFCRDLRDRGGKPVDKVFRDSLYEGS